MIETVVMSKEATSLNTSSASSNNCSSFDQQTVPLLNAPSAKSDTTNPICVGDTSTLVSSSSRNDTQVVLPYTRHVLSLSTKSPPLEDAREGQAALLSDPSTAAANGIDAATSPSTTDAVNEFPVRVVPSPPPAALTAAGLSREQWDMFAAKVQPILERLENLESTFWLSLIQAFCIIPMIDPSPFPGCITFPFVMFGIFLFFANVVYEVIRLKLWKSLMRLAEAMACQDSGHTGVFPMNDRSGSSSWTNMECMYEWFDSFRVTKKQGVKRIRRIRRKGFRLYFFPPPAVAEQVESSSMHLPSAALPELEESNSSYDVHPKGYYLRFPITWRHRFVNPLACLPKELPQIPCYQSLPAAFRDRLDEDSWSRFALDWQVASSKGLASQHRITMHLRICLVLWLALCVLTFFEPFPVWMYIVVLMAFVIVVVRIFVDGLRKLRAIQQRLSKIKAFSDSVLVNKGLYLEQRCIAEVGSYYGLHRVYYLYLFRLPTATVYESTVAEP